MQAHHVARPGPGARARPPPRVHRLPMTAVAGSPALRLFASEVVMRAGTGCRGLAGGGCGFASPHFSNPFLFFSHDLGNKLVVLGLGELWPPLAIGE